MDTCKELFAEGKDLDIEHTEEPHTSHHMSMSQLHQCMGCGSICLRYFFPLSDPPVKCKYKVNVTFLLTDL